MLYPKPKNTIRKILTPFITFPHKCMYDTETLLKILTEIGFEVEERKGMESSIEDISNIEIESRTLNSVIVEGKKILIQSGINKKINIA